MGYLLLVLHAVAYHSTTVEGNKFTFIVKVSAGEIGDSL